ncbi:MAG: hypothetical protein IPJ57_20675 [Gemmatimonadetes bacterium]|nr:hypothetical protein [Gemmatimonadota bacterium]
MATGRFGRAAIEPFTAYGVGRVQQEVGKNQSVVGVSLTSVYRSSGRHGARGAAGRAGHHRRRRLEPALQGRHLRGRRVRGREPRGGRRGGHRAGAAGPGALPPASDATEFDFESTRTSLTGYAAGLNASKNSGKHWLGSVGVSTESPYWELNDVGRLQSANDADGFVELRYRENTRGKLFHRWSSNAFLGRGWNYAGIPTYTEASLGNSFTFHNFMRLFLGVYGNLAEQSDDLTGAAPSWAGPAASVATWSCRGTRASPSPGTLA